MRKWAIYYDSCGHHAWNWDPSLQAWHIADSSSGGSGTVTSVIISNDSVYYTTTSGKTFIFLALTQADSTIKYTTPTQLTTAVALRQYSLIWLPITYYNAIADSSTDNTAAIQACVDSITRSSTKKGVIYMPAGVYKVNGTIHIPLGDQISFIGAGGSSGAMVNGTCKIVTSRTTGDVIVDSANNTIFEDFDIQNNGALPTAGAGIHMVGWFARISRILISNFYYDLELDNSLYDYVSKTTLLEAVQYSLYVNNNPLPDYGDLTIDGCIFQSGTGSIPHATVAAIYQPNSGGIKISHCKFNGSSTGIQTCIRGNFVGSANSTSDLLVATNSFEGFSKYALWITCPGANFANIAFTGNQIAGFGSSGNGILLDGTSGGLHRVAISGNTFNSIDTGIQAYHVDQLKISGNSIDSPSTVSYKFVTTFCTNCFFDDWNTGGGSGGATLTYGTGLVPGSYNGGTAQSINVDTFKMAPRDALDSVAGLTYNYYIQRSSPRGDTLIHAYQNLIRQAGIVDSLDSHHVINGDSSWTFYTQAHDTTSGNALQSKYRSDTARANLYAALGTKIVNAGASVSIKTGIYSARPSASNCQCYYGATDSAKWYYDNGSWITMGGGSSGGAGLPSQTGNANLYLQTNGTSALWGDPRQLDTLYVVDDGQSNDYGNADAGYIGDTASDYRVLVADTVTGGFKVAHAGFYPFNTQSPTQYSLSSSFYFARKFARQYGKYVKLIHNGHNGQAIAAWYTSGAPQALLDSLIGRINRFGFPRVDVFIWDQGESDNGTVFSTYTTAYDSLISTLHEQCPAFTFSTSILDVGMPQVALGAPTGYQGQDPNIQTVDYNYNLRDGYVITDSAYINTTTASNPVHFNAKGLQILGERAEWDTWMALPVLSYTRNNPGTLAGAPINPGRVTVRYTEAPGAGAYYDGVNTLNRSTTGRTGFRALSSDSVSTVGGIFLAGPSGSYFSSNQLVAGTETNSDFILSRNFVNYVQLTSTGITMAQKLNYTSSNEAAFTNTTSSSGTGFTFTGDASNFVNLQLGNSASTIPNSLNLYVNNGYKQVWQPSGTRIMDSATFTGSVKSTLEIYGSRGLKIDSLTSNVTLGNHNNIVMFVTGTGIDTCYLPISTGDYMRVYTIRKADTGTTGTVKILLASGSDKIDRAGTSLTLTGSNPIVQVISNGVNGYYTLTPTSSSGTSYYQTAQNSGGSLTQRAKLNATGNIVATDNSGNGSTDLSVVVNTASGTTDSVTTTNPSTGAQNRTTLLGLEKNSGLSGIYLPTITVYASTCTINSLDSAVWSQNGNVVTIDGTVNVSPASSGLSTIFYISLPVSSNLNGHNMWGTATSSAQVPTVVGSAGGFINGFTSGGLAQVGFVSGTTSGTNASTWNYHLSYKLE